MNNLPAIQNNNLNKIEDFQEIVNQIEHVLAVVGLPSENIFTKPNERCVVFRNLGDVISNVPKEKLGESFYISKFIAAVFSGLFDAALNYLWDETIKELRIKIAHYDIVYFYDVVLKDSNKRKEYKDADDLVKLSDRDLLLGAKEIDLITDVGFQELTNIGYMRNWVSAAHPNNYELSGLQLATFLETCIKNVISLNIDKTAIAIQQILSNMRKETLLPDDTVNQLVINFSDFKETQINSLCQGLFGIYTEPKSSEINRTNIKKIIKPLWERANNEVKYKIGLKYGSFSINGDDERKQLSESFLKFVNGMKYIPDDVKAAKIISLLEDLVNANDSFNNFYVEPNIARELSSLISETRIPTIIEKDYVSKILYVFLTNGSGTAWNAEGYYIDMIHNFTEMQKIIALSLIEQDEFIKRKLNYSLCVKKYKQFLQLLLPQFSDQVIITLIDLILHFTGPFTEVMKDSNIKTAFGSFKKSYNLG